jgi:hypothetical protein
MVCPSGNLTFLAEEAVLLSVLVLLLLLDLEDFLLLEHLLGDSPDLVFGSLLLLDDRVNGERLGVLYGLISLLSAAWPAS